ncbi:hypothetical protein DID88_001222 [Monilinia fructigena]|uniref:Uncharacterized protein n=1 Tax=Monilinia fructigena TaxID=38457 RepID=A0A395IYM7_9HELO|nr:hypothetical protein DID88_001222 [Monilinia fructigena]
MSPSKPKPQAEEKKKAVAGARIEHKITTGAKHTTSLKQTRDNAGENRVKPIETLASEQNIVAKKTDMNNAELMDQDMDMDVDKIQGNIFFHLHSALENTAVNITDVLSSKFANTRPASNGELVIQDVDMEIDKIRGTIFFHLHNALENTTTNITDIMGTNLANIKPASNVELTYQDTQVKESHGSIFSYLHSTLQQTEVNITDVMCAAVATFNTTKAGPSNIKPASNVELTYQDTQVKESHGSIFSYLHGTLQQTEVNITDIMHAVVAKVNTAKAESAKTKPASMGLDTQGDLKYEDIASHFRYMAARARIFKGSSRWKYLRRVS